MNYISEKQNQILIRKADLLIEELKPFPDQEKIRILQWRIDLLKKLLINFFKEK